MKCLRHITVHQDTETRFMRAIPLSTAKGTNIISSQKYCFKTGKIGKISNEDEDNYYYIFRMEVMWNSWAMKL